MTYRMVLVAAPVIILACVLSRADVRQARPPSGLSVKVLLKTSVSADPAHEAIIAEARFAPGASTGLHTHPGDEYATVLDGELQISGPGEPPHAVRAGEAYHNARNVVHETRNVGSGAARVISTFIIDAGQPILKPAVSVVAAPGSHGGH